MASELESGTQSATIGTEHTLGTDPELTDAAQQLVVDLANMVIGDILEIRLYEKVLSGGTQRELDRWTVSHNQSGRAFVSPAMILIHGSKWTLKQTAGTGRSFPWSKRSAG